MATLSPKDDVSTQGTMFSTSDTDIVVNNNHDNNNNNDNKGNTEKGRIYTFLHDVIDVDTNVQDNNNNNNYNYSNNINIRKVNSNRDPDIITNDINTRETPLEDMYNNNNNNIVLTRARPYKKRTIILGICTLLIIILEIISLSSYIYRYKKGIASVDISYFSITICPVDGNINNRSDERVCKTTSYLGSEVCSSVSSKIKYSGISSIGILFTSLVLLVFIVVEYGGTVVHPSLGMWGVIIIWFTAFIRFIIFTQVFLGKLCKDTSLHSIGFEYGAGWLVVFLEWLMLSTIIPVLFFLRKKLH